MLEDKLKQRINSARLDSRSRNLGASGLQQLAILNPGRTGGFAGAAPQTTIDMILKRLGLDRQPPFLNRAHKIDTAAWAVILVPGGDVSRAGFQTQPAMYASKNLFLFRGEGFGQH
jgi:hypothetical protein